MDRIDRMRIYRHTHDLAVSSNVLIYSAKKHQLMQPTTGLSASIWSRKTLRRIKNLDTYEYLVFYSLPIFGKLFYQVLLKGNGEA